MFFLRAVFAWQLLRCVCVDIHGFQVDPDSVRVQYDILQVPQESA